MRFGDYSNALRIALRLMNQDLISEMYFLIDI